MVDGMERTRVAGCHCLFDPGFAENGMCQDSFQISGVLLGRTIRAWWRKCTLLTMA